MHFLLLMIHAFIYSLTERDMANSVQNAANYKVRRVEKDDQKPFRPLYMDGAATTPIDPRVLDAMLPFQTSYYGNPHSVSHAYGWQAEAAVERAREEVILNLSDKPFTCDKGRKFNRS